MSYQIAPYSYIKDFSNENDFKTEHDLREQIYELKDRIMELEKENRKNLSKISELINAKNNFLKLEKAKEALTEELINKKELISELKKNLLKEEKNKREEKRLLENQFDTKLTYYKRIQETNKYKESTASSIIKLNELQHYSIIKLENKIDEIKNFYENQLKEKEHNFDKKYTNLKKKMMDFLKNTQKNMIKNSKENLELNTKLSTLYKNEMLNELESQSRLIEDLIKEKEKQTREIYLLKQELIVHRKVEEMIKNKNSKFLNVINKINIKINQNKGNYNYREQNENTDSNMMKENYNKINIKNIKRDLKKRAKSVKPFKIKSSGGNAGILSNYLDESYSRQFKNKTPSCKTPKIIKNNTEEKMIGTNLEIEEIEEKPINQFNNDTDDKPEIYNLINEIIILCNKALEFIFNKNKYSHIFKDIPFLSDVDIKFDYFELSDDLKYELLIEIIKKVLNFLKLNKKEKDDIIKINKSNNELLKLNDSFSFKYSGVLKNEYINNIQKLKVKNQKLKYDKIINMIGINKSKYITPEKFFSFKIKKNKLLNKRGESNLIDSFKNNTQNLLKRYIHISNNMNKRDFMNKTFLNSKT